MATNRKLTIVAVFIAMGVVRAGGQTVETLVVKSLPASFTVLCEPPAPSGARIDVAKLTYVATIDGGEPGAPSPTCKFTFNITTDGAHAVSVVARYPQADGKFATSAPVIVRFTTEILGAARSQPPASKPIEAPFTDPDGHAWTLVGTDVQMDGKHAPDAGPCARLILASGKVYVFGDKLWWLWNANASPHWSSAGPGMPK